MYKILYGIIFISCVNCAIFRNQTIEEINNSIYRYPFVQIINNTDLTIECRSLDFNYNLSIKTDYSQEFIVNKTIIKKNPIYNNTHITVPLDTLKYYTSISCGRNNFYVKSFFSILICPINCDISNDIVNCYVKLSEYYVFSSIFYTSLKVQWVIGNITETVLYPTKVINDDNNKQFTLVYSLDISKYSSVNEIKFNFNDSYLFREEYLEIIQNKDNHLNLKIILFCMMIIYTFEFFLIYNKK